MKPENLKRWTIHKTMRHILLHLIHIVRITSPELQPMAVQYTGHGISVYVAWQRYCTVIGWSSGDIIRAIRTICNILSSGSQAMIGLTILYIQYSKVLIQGKLFQRCTHFLYCRVLSLGGKVNTRRMSQPDMESIFTKLIDEIFWS